MPDHDEHRSPEEIRQRMEAAIKRAQQKAPSNPHAEFDKGSRGGKGPKSPAPKARNFRHQGR